MRFAALVVLTFLAATLAGCVESEEFTPPSAQAVVVAAAGNELTQVRPVPQNAGDYVIVQRDGLVLLLEEGEPRASTVVDMEGEVSFAFQENEYGLKSLAFHPDFADNGMVFLGHTDADQNTVVTRFFADPADASTPWQRGDELFSVRYNTTPFHNFAEMQFGPDGYLYLTMGDPSFVRGAQYQETFYGKMLRIDVDGASGYEVPPGNPFAGQEDKASEIWLYGMRNPWRFDIDDNGDIYIADTGHGRMEEVSIYRSGDPTSRNFGWPWYEGSLRYRNDTGPPAGYYSPTAEPYEELNWPVAEYTHDEGCAIIGGVLYKGDLFPELQESFIIAEHCFSEMRIVHEGPDGWEILDWFEVPNDRINSIDEDHDEELLITSRLGKFYRVVPA